MIRRILLVFLFKAINQGYKFQNLQELLNLTPYPEKLEDNEKYIEDMSNVAGFDDAEHRGHAWYDYSSSDKAYQSDLDDDITSTEDSSTSLDWSSESESSGASSQETKERRLATRVYRECTPCPHDMMKKHKNRGIKWICGRYQRARRSFKSECMMRYRNCQDGTMFVKMSDHRCKNDSFHGRHWFYVYNT